MRLGEDFGGVQKVRVFGVGAGLDLLGLFVEF